MASPLLGYYPPDDLGIFFETFCETLDHTDSNSLLIHQIIEPVTTIVHDAKNTRNHFVGRRRFKRWITHVQNTIGIDVARLSYDEAIENSESWDIFSEWFEEVASYEAAHYIFGDDVSAVYDVAAGLGLMYDIDSLLRTAAKSDPKSFIIACDTGWHQPFLVYGSPTITFGKAICRPDGPPTSADVTEPGDALAFGIPPSVMKDLLETYSASET